jgi:hypothetical protein
MMEIESGEWVGGCGKVSSASGSWHELFRSVHHASFRMDLTCSRSFHVVALWKHSL